MHYSAKRGIEIACRLSVGLSETLVDQDHISWKSWKLIAQTISPTSSLFVAQRPSNHLFSEEHGEILGETRDGVAKFWRAGAQKRQYLCLKRVNIDEKLLYRGPIGTHQRSFERYHFRPPTANPSPRLGVYNPNSKLLSLLSQ